jgi:hypothetical protein
MIRLHSVGSPVVRQRSRVTESGTVPISPESRTVRRSARGDVFYSQPPNDEGRVVMVKS